MYMNAKFCGSWIKPRPSRLTKSLTGRRIGVTRLGSPASPRIVPVDAAACRAIETRRLETPLKS